MDMSLLYAGRSFYRCRFPDLQAVVATIATTTCAGSSYILS
jgi:hypothetical protein